MVVMGVNAPEVRVLGLTESRLAQPMLPSGMQPVPICGYDVRSGKLPLLLDLT